MIFGRASICSSTFPHIYQSFIINRSLSTSSSGSSLFNQPPLLIINSCPPIYSSNVRLPSNPFHQALRTMFISYHAPPFYVCLVCLLLLVLYMSSCCCFCVQALINKGSSEVIVAVCTPFLIAAAAARAWV
jgi:hypothetical protein